jgi:hypothetical protein
MTKRFDSTISVEELLASQYAKKTANTDHYAWNLLTAYIDKTKANIDFTVSTSINAVLCDFYSAVRKEDGSFFTINSLSSIRSALIRVIKKKFDIDISKDATFAKSESVFEAMKRHLKKNGKGETTHYPVISEEDLCKIAEFTPTTPTELQLKVWFTLHFHFALRGRENLHSLEREDLIFSTQNGMETIRPKDNVTKNHRNDTSSSIGAVIYKSKDENCPILLVKKYLSLLNSENKYLWQRALARPDLLSQPSYTSHKVGVNTVNGFMKKVCLTLKLGSVYTNHSVRATSLTVLGSGFQDTEIAHFSGHRSLSALGIYKRVSKSKQQEMSQCLHERITGSSSISANTNLVQNMDLHCDLFTHDDPNGPSSHACPTGPITISPPSPPTQEDPVIPSTNSNLQQEMDLPCGPSPHDRPTGPASSSSNSFIYSDINKLCAQQDSRVFSSFAPNLQNCTNISFTFNFHK